MRYVKVDGYPGTIKVSTVGCGDICEFLGGVQERARPILDNVSPLLMTLHETLDGPAIDATCPVPVPNENSPLIVKIVPEGMLHFYSNHFCLWSLAIVAGMFLEQCQPFFFTKYRYFIYPVSPAFLSLPLSSKPFLVMQNRNDIESWLKCRVVAAEVRAHLARNVVEEHEG